MQTSGSKAVPSTRRGARGSSQVDAGSTAGRTVSNRRGLTTSSTAGRAIISAMAGRCVRSSTKTGINSDGKAGTTSRTAGRITIGRTEAGISTCSKADASN